MKWGSLLVLLLLPGCYTLADAARERAAYDLRCPSDKIDTYHAVGGTTVARGCGAWTEYQCFATRGGPHCIRDATAQINTSAPPDP